MRKKVGRKKWTTSSILWNDLLNSHGHGTSVATFYWQCPPTHISKKFFYTLPNIKRLWKYCDRHQKKLSSCVRHKERIRAQKKMKIAVLLREIKLSVHRTHKSIVIEHSFFLFLVASIFLYTRIKNSSSVRVAE